MSKAPTTSAEQSTFARQAAGGAYVVLCLDVVNAIPAFTQTGPGTAPKATGTDPEQAVFSVLL
jgi:hypothetical protein